MSCHSQKFKFDQLFSSDLLIASVSVVTSDLIFAVLGEVDFLYNSLMHCLVAPLYDLQYPVGASSDKTGSCHPHTPTPLLYP